MNHDKGEKPEVGQLTGEEVAKHNSKDSCWVIVHGKAYDVTDFLPGMPPTLPSSRSSTNIL
jgi:L-lactate dehydrogenase (cytochrome)